jgi:hypothetical protein
MCRRTDRSEAVAVSNSRINPSREKVTQVNPFDFRKEYVISAFDLKHNFVFSYNYELPFDKLFRASNRLTQGWAISGVTRFSAGLPVTFQSFGDNALVQVQNNGVNSVSIDLPD